MNEMLQKFREKYPQYNEMSDLELAKAIHRKFYADVMTFGDFAGRIKLNTGPTEQPPFEKLPPLAGGILDAMVAFGSGAGLGLPRLSGDTQAYMKELQNRAPGATMAAQGAGAATTALLGAKAVQAAKQTMAEPGRWLQARMYGSTKPYPGTVAPSPGVGSTALNLLKNRYLKGGLGGAVATEVIRRLVR